MPVLTMVAMPSSAQPSGKVPKTMNATGSAATVCRDREQDPGKHLLPRCRGRHQAGKTPVDR
jgi:hypothetical protein